MRLGLGKNNHLTYASLAQPLICPNVMKMSESEHLLEWSSCTLRGVLLNTHYISFHGEI